MNHKHGVSLSEYAAALGAMSTHNMDHNAVLEVLNINSEQWTEVCSEYQFAAMTDMGTYMQYFGNPSLCPKFSNLSTNTENTTTAPATNIFDQLMNQFSGFAVNDNDDFEHNPTVPSEKRHLLSFGAIILHQHPVDTFEINGYKSDLKAMLENSWNITNHEEAIEILEWLKNEGHREAEIEIDEDTEDDIKEYEKALSPSLKLNIDENGNPKDIDAWDIERIASVSRYSYAAGYIDMENCLSYLEIANNMAKQRYNNWSEYASSFMTGRVFMYGANPSAFATAILGMLSNPKSMWNLYPLKN